MRIEKIQNRLQFLHLCLHFSSQKQEKLTILDRMLINQERGQLLKEIDYPKTEPRPVPETVEIKLKEIQLLIDKYDWKPLNINQLNGGY
ncbi:hypothetical protein [Flavobacterium sp.]|uniref:hypothetical protein n=1 Tax=Flavobacterium sp. TaxID=239 RepID=UPI0037505261